MEQHSSNDRLKADKDKSPASVDVNFVNYITSLGLQALIFMGETPSPITQQHEKNLDQARILIDTLVMLRDKTKGNLSEQENSLLDASIYELQIKFVEAGKKDGPQA